MNEPGVRFARKWEPETGIGLIDRIARGDRCGLSCLESAVQRGLAYCASASSSTTIRPARSLVAVQSPQPRPWHRMNQDGY